MLEHRARLNDKLAEDARRSPKRAEWHRDQAAFLRKQDKQKQHRTERTW
jgi:hypothetical protein